MVFSSFTFLIYFLPPFLLIYFLVPKDFRNAVIFVGSLIFYYYGVKDHPFYLVLMLLTTTINYLAAQKMARAGYRRRKKWLILGLFWNIGCLFVFKYMNFISTNLNELLKLCNVPLALPYLHLVLPIGISFYTFQISSYLIDVYRKDIPTEHSLLTLGTYLCMFPQLIAGPIVTYSKVQKQMYQRNHSFRNLEEGMREFTIGLSLKVLIANRVGGLWSQIGSIGYESISCSLAWLGIFAYSFQIYFDFYGYSLMAKGLGRMMGFTFPDNFRNPYLSLTMSEFWRRWHITLGSWFREYVYIPLGGNRRGIYRNLFFVWMLTGLWHGANWNFILWGLSIYLIISLEKLGFGQIFNKVPALGHLYMCLLIPLSWLLFAVTDLSQIKIYLMRLFPILGQTTSTVYSQDFLTYGRACFWPLLAALLCCTGLPRKLYEAKKYTFVITLSLVALFWACMYCMYLGMDDPFLYYQF